MQNKLVVDVESQFLAAEIGGWNNTNKMKVACAVVYDYEAKRFRTYDNNELEELKKTIENASEVIWFAGDNFDGSVIWELPNRQLPKQLVGKTNDLYRRICIGAGRNPNAGNKGFGLGAICEATIGRGKIESGLDAPKMFHAGQWGRLFRYCIDDVTLCRDLYNFIENEGHVIGPKGIRIQVPKWQSTAK